MLLRYCRLNCVCQSTAHATCAFAKAVQLHVIILAINGHILWVVHFALYEIGDRLVARRALASDVEVVGMLSNSYGHLPENSGGALQQCGSQ